jgi:hypothetical protein
MYTTLAWLLHPANMKASVPIFVVAGAAGLWLALVLVVLKSIGITVP